MTNIWNWYTRIVAQYPVPVLIGISFLGLTSIICSLTLHDLPDFSDPQAGFETRGTIISRRLTAWENLLEAVSHVGPLTTNPLEARGMVNRVSIIDASEILEKKLERKRKRERRRRKNNMSGSSSGSPGNSRRRLRNGVTEENVGVGRGGANIEGNDDDSRRKREAQLLIKGTEYLSSKNVDNAVDDDVQEADANVARDDSDEDDVVIASLVAPQSTGGGAPGRQQQIAWLCGEPMPDYAHVVFKSTKSPPQFKDLCETKGPAHCCPGWSLGGYIGIMNNRSSCFNIRESDVKSTLLLLEKCAPFYHSGELTGECLANPRPCVRVPPECVTHNAVFTILHFLTDDRFLAVENKSPHLSYVMSFLPLGRSSATLEYFHNVEPKPLRDARTEIIAMDLGLKDTLFDEYLIEDAVYLLVALALISFSILFYTRSLFLTISTIMAILFSLSFAYFTYVFVARVKFFPFMNILATVVAVGVGADDTFILVKSWRTFQNQKPDPDTAEHDHVIDLVRRTMRHSVMTMIVTSVTTSAAFFASSVSSITAIKCFSLFSGMTILSNLILMLTWSPACLVIHYQYCRRFTIAPLSTYSWVQAIPSLLQFAQRVENFNSKWDQLWRKMFKSIFPRSVMKARYIVIVLFVCLAVGSTVVVFHYPGTNAIKPFLPKLMASVTRFGEKLPI